MSEQASKTRELKLCPFCGEEPVKVGADEAACTNCCIHKTAEHWNTRADNWISVDNELPPLGEKFDAWSITEGRLANHGTLG